MRTRAYRFSGGIRPSLRNGFTAYSVLSLVTGFLATIAPRTNALAFAREKRLLLKGLDASIGAPEPHDFAVRISAVRQRHIRVHRIPPRVRDVRERPSGRDEMRVVKPVICPTTEAEYFRVKGSTGFW